MAPRTRRTQFLEPFKKQFYQWYFTDGYTLYQVTVLFNWLFVMLFKVNKADYYATEEQDWMSRLREWNKDWRCRKNQPAGSQPEHSIPGEIWFKKGPKGLILVDKELLPVCDEASSRPNFIASIEYLTLQSDPIRCLYSSAGDYNNPLLDVSASNSFDIPFPSISKPLGDSTVQSPTRHKPVIPHSAIMANGFTSDSSKVYYSPYSSMGLPTRAELPAGICDTRGPQKLMRELHGTSEAMSPGRERGQFPSSTAPPPTRTNGLWGHATSQNDFTTYEDFAFPDISAYGSEVQPTLNMGSQFSHNYEASAPYLDNIHPSLGNYGLHQHPNANLQQYEGSLYQVPSQDLSPATFSTPCPSLQEQSLQNGMKSAWQDSRPQTYSGPQHRAVYTTSLQNGTQRSPVMLPVPADRILRSAPSSTGTDLNIRRMSVERTQPFSSKSSRFPNHVPHQTRQ